MNDRFITSDPYPPRWNNLENADAYMKAVAAGKMVNPYDFGAIRPFKTFNGVTHLSEEYVAAHFEMVYLAP